MLTSNDLLESLHTVPTSPHITSFNNRRPSISASKLISLQRSALKYIYFFSLSVVGTSVGRFKKFQMKTRLMMTHFRLLRV